VERTTASTGERVVLAAGLLLILDLFFLPWYHHAFVLPYVDDRTALEPPVGWLAVLAWLLTIALVAQVLVPRLSQRGLPEVAVPWERIALGEAAGVFALLLIKLLVTGHIGFGAWIAMLLAALLAYGTWRSATESQD
jgi:hypothetical protein